MITRRGFVTSSITATAALQAQQPPPERPNLLFILADGWRGQVLPCAGDPDLIAPNLARLAKEGVYCSRTYTSYPVCCPSRAAMLSGKFPHAAGVPHNHMRLPMDQPTMSAAMQRAGYRTGYIGKWHLDGAENPGFVAPERRRGFEYWAAYNVAHQHYDGVYFRDSPEPIKTTGFEADYQTGLALDFIGRKSDQPFFLYLSWVPPHAPFTPPDGRRPVYDPAGMHLRANVPERGEAQVRKDLAGYYGLCSALDANLGRLLQGLDNRGLAEKTIVVFTSDHGHMLGSHGLDAIDLPYDESSRIPLLIRYPRRIKAASEYEALVSNVDFAPTFLSLCGVEAPEGMQGVNLAGQLTTGEGAEPESIFSEGSLGQPGEWRMIVRGFDKLVTDKALKPTQLYNLAQDPHELQNLLTEGAERRKKDELGALLRRWVFRTGDRAGG